MQRPEPLQKQCSPNVMSSLQKHSTLFQYGQRWVCCDILTKNKKNSSTNVPSAPSAGRQTCINHAAGHIRQGAHVSVDCMMQQYSQYTTHLVESAKGLVQYPRSTDLGEVRLHEGFRLGQCFTKREEGKRRRLLHLIWPKTRGQGQDERVYIPHNTTVRSYTPIGHWTQARVKAGLEFVVLSCSSTN